MVYAYNASFLIEFFIFQLFSIIVCSWIKRYHLVKKIKLYLYPKQSRIRFQMRTVITQPFGAKYDSK